MDMMNKLLKTVDHGRGKVIGILLGLMVVVGIVGCDLAVTSDISGNTVTEPQFQMEVQTATAGIEAERIALNSRIDLLNAQVESTGQKIQKAQEFRDGIVRILAGVAVTASNGGSVDLAQVMISALTLAGIGGTIGGTVDANRKNKIITELKKS